VRRAFLAERRTVGGLLEPAKDETALPNVFAAGDVAYYEGKITLITIGLGEAAIAANQCVARARGVKLQPAYSTE
jgi:thioredoxin reductase (NADPH)